MILHSILIQKLAKYEMAGGTANAQDHGYMCVVIHGVKHSQCLQPSHSLLDESEVE